MSESSEHSDLWHWPTLLLWSIFFLIGLFPEHVFYGLRAFAKVPTHKAFINSYHLITLGLTAYLYLFTYRRGLEARLSRAEAHGKALQIGLLSLCAFLPITQVVLAYKNIPINGLRNMVLGVGTVKLAAWIYLYSILIRYYCFEGPEVYQRMRSIFPSSLRAARDRGQKASQANGED